MVLTWAWSPGSLLPGCGPGCPTLAQSQWPGWPELAAAEPEALIRGPGLAARRWWWTRGGAASSRSLSHRDESRYSGWRQPEARAAVTVMIAAASSAGSDPGPSPGPGQAALGKSTSISSWPRPEFWVIDLVSASGGLHVPATAAVWPGGAGHWHMTVTGCQCCWRGQAPRHPY